MKRMPLVNFTKEPIEFTTMKEIHDNEAESGELSDTKGLTLGPWLADMVLAVTDQFDEEHYGFVRIPAGQKVAFYFIEQPMPKPVTDLMGGKDEVP